MHDKRKNGDIFSQEGKRYEVVEVAQGIRKCRLCSLHHNRWGCFGDLDITGDCLPTKTDKRNLIFKLKKD